MMNIKIIEKVIDGVIDRYAKSLGATGTADDTEAWGLVKKDLAQALIKMLHSKPVDKDFAERKKKELEEKFGWMYASLEQPDGSKRYAEGFYKLESFLLTALEEAVKGGKDG